MHVKGNLTIEPGAKLTGGVRAATVIIGGELEGNIDQAQKVELLQSGVLNGNLNAGSLTVAAGSRMRGQAEFGWDRQACALRYENGERLGGMSTARVGAPGATRSCPHCKATILESANVCPICRHHLRFDRRLTENAQSQFFRSQGGRERETSGSRRGLGVFDDAHDSQ